MARAGRFGRVPQAGQSIISEIHQGDFIWGFWDFFSGVSGYESTLFFIGIEKHNLLFGVRRSIRYHNARRKFFDRCHKITTATSLIFGSAAIFTVLSNAGPIYTIAAAAFVSIVAAIDLVVGNTDKARLHHDLSKRFIALEKEIISEREPTDDDLSLWTATRLEIESEEPPVKRVLDAMMHNDLLRAMDYEEDSGPYVRIGTLQRQVAQLFDFRQHTLRKRT